MVKFLFLVRCCFSCVVLVLVLIRMWWVMVMGMELFFVVGWNVYFSLGLLWF